VHRVDFVLVQQRPVRVIAPVLPAALALAAAARPARARHIRRRRLRRVARVQLHPLLQPRHLLAQLRQLLAQRVDYLVALRQRLRLGRQVHLA
jgi:hypothetical protein